MQTLDDVILFFRDKEIQEAIGKDICKALVSAAEVVHKTMLMQRHSALVDCLDKLVAVSTKLKQIGAVPTDGLDDFISDLDDLTSEAAVYVD